MTNIHQNRTSDQIRQLTNNLLDLDIAVDDARQSVAREVDDLRRLVALRDAAAKELAGLVGQPAA